MLVLTSNTLTILTPCLTLTSTFTVITTAVEHSVLTNTAAQASTHTPDTRADWTCQILSLGRAAAAFNVCDETHVFPRAARRSSRRTERGLVLQPNHSEAVTRPHG